MLERLDIDFDISFPNIDETPLPAETPLALARRLALTKAESVLQRMPQAAVIGCDQVIDFHGQPLGKPLSFDGAVAQLLKLSGQTVTFHSALAVVTQQHRFISVVDSVATFRVLDPVRIERYLSYDQPFDTAGSAKAESLGIALLQRLSSEDPTAIIGLPLIELTRLLCYVGFDPLLRHKRN
jgi:septum formation protein